MSEHLATIRWKRSSEDFSYKNYNREHEWSFASGTSVRASATPEYLGDPTCVDPEEAFVASLASCHMLTFLAIASQKKLTVETYTDEAVGILEKNSSGKLAITRVILSPKIVFETEVSKEMLSEMHEKAHHNCFIANSVTTDISVQG